jgi:hypothetical protein
MTTSSRRFRLSPPITRHFESTRTHKQSIENAYQILIPAISRRSRRPRFRPDDDAIEAASPGFRSRAEGA